MREKVSSVFDTEPDDNAEIPDRRGNMRTRRSRKMFPGLRPKARPSVHTPIPEENKTVAIVKAPTAATLDSFTRRDAPSSSV